jgi:hypothetical protein
MAQYEYKFVKIPRSPMTKQKDRLKADDFKKCKDVIASEAQNGWRLKQVVVPYQERFGLYIAKGYEIIFEREVN